MPIILNLPESEDPHKTCRQEIHRLNKEIIKLRQQLELEKIYGEVRVLKNEAR